MTRNKLKRRTAVQTITILLPDVRQGDLNTHLCATATVLNVSWHQLQPAIVFMKNTKPYLNSSAWTDPAPQPGFSHQGWHFGMACHDHCLQLKPASCSHGIPQLLSYENSWVEKSPGSILNCLQPACCECCQPGCGRGSRTRELPVPRSVPIPSLNNARRLDMFFTVTSTGRWWYSCHVQSFLPRKRKVAGRKGGKCTEVDMKFSLLCYSCVSSWRSPLECNSEMPLTTPRLSKEMDIFRQQRQTLLLNASVRLG